MRRGAHRGRGGEEGEIGGGGFHGLARGFHALDGFQNLFGAGDHLRRQAGQLGDVDAVGAVRRAVRDFVQKDDIVLPFLDAHGVAGKARQGLRQAGELMIVRGEEGAAFVGLVQIFEAGPGDGKSVVGRRAAADLVEDDQRAFRRLIEDRRGFDHLDHEGRASARQIVRRADAAEQAVHRADMRAFRRNVATHLRHQRDQRVLPQKRRFPRHVRAGEQPEA